MKDFLSTLARFFAHLRFVKNSPLVLPRLFSGVFKTVVLKQNVLRVVELAVNYKCNSRCVFCSAARLLDPEKEKNLFSAEDYRKIGKELDRLGAIGIVITGGEPLLRQDICQIVEALGPKNKIISLVTNSLLLTQEKAYDLKRAGLNAIEFSIEADNAKENDVLRGVKGHFAKVMRGVKYAQKAGLNICFSPCLSHQNIKSFPRFIKFAQKHGAFILLSLAGIVGRWTDKDEFRLDEKDWQLMQEYQRQYHFIRNDFDTNFSLRAGCPTGREKLYISPYGDIIPCSFTHLSFGNLKTEPLEKIWKRMGKFSYFAKEAPYCLRTMDKEYVQEILEPIKDYPFLPMPIAKHPAGELRKLSRE